MKIFITGGAAGFIGSALIHYLVFETEHQIINVDKLTYTGNRASLKLIADNLHYHFEQVDICDAAANRQLFMQYQPDIVMHLAAESHVDRSIDGPLDFIQTNVVGTSVLLEAARTEATGKHCLKAEKPRFVFIIYPPTKYPAV